ncbi:cholesterol 25-hydroxylase-like [Clavelina lepadiformis]|uniref:Fatty acid hydroxylase domain-containing protein n=1 Tax=Clavelina lepadiformis TaxID=159417 RepID=A0ABP0FP00_CLALP
MTGIGSSKKLDEAKKKPDPGITVIRIFLLSSLWLVYQNSDQVQYVIDWYWNWLRHTWWYNTVYNETLYVIALTFPMYLMFRCVDRLGIGAKYKISSGAGNWEDKGCGETGFETLEYFCIFGFLDTFHVKHYAGVPEGVIAEKRNHWIQITRALPENAPMLKDIAVHLLLSVVIFDALFFALHLAFHKSALFYRIFHKQHHTHDFVNVKVTNRLHFVDRLATVLTANFGLKVVSAHPLTRSIFTFFYVLVLILNHSGLDLPYSYEKIVPWGVIGGPRRHFEHHEYGARYYQPIFTYLDTMLEWMRQRNKTD